MMSKRPTTKEIAKIAAVSVGTVDRVIHNRGQVSEKTRQKVLKIVKELNYEPNMVARHLVLKKTYNIIALLPKAEGSDYWFKPQNGIKRADEDLKQMPLEVNIILFDPLDSDDFKDKAKVCLKESPDGVIVSPVIYNEAAQFTSQLNENQIPFIFIDSNIDESNPLCFIGQNSFQSGFLAAKLLNWGNKNIKNPLIILPKSHTDNNRINSKRIIGFKTYFDAKSIKVREVSTDLELKDIQSGSRVNLENAEAIFVPNSKVYLVASLLKEKGLNEKPHLIGFDLIPKNVESLKDGSIDFLIHQKPETQGYLAVQTFFKYLVLNEKVQHNTHYMPLDIITRENLDYFEK